MRHDATPSPRVQSLRRTPAPIRTGVRESAPDHAREQRNAPSDVQLQSAPQHLALDDADLEVLLELARASSPIQARLQATRLRSLLGDDAQRLEDLIDALVARARETACLKRMAGTDGLTGICNRRGFAENLRRELARARRHGDALSLLLFDVDCMKLINDGPGGHAAGDRALCTIARCLRQVVRQNDLVARVGGDEFAVILPATDLGLARAVGERIRSEVTRVSKGQLGVSFGVALTRDAEGASALLAAADTALYRDKTSRRASRPRSTAAAD